MLDICDIKSKKITKISKILEKSDRFQLRECKDDAYPHRACHFIKEHENLEIINTYVDFRKIITGDDDEWDNVYCGFYDQKNNFKSENTFLKLMEYMEQNKTIFIIIDINNYYIIPEINPDKVGRKVINTPQMHSVCAIFQPIDKHNYNVFYINSHGCGVRDEKVFETSVSNTRVKSHKFNNHINYVFMNKFVTNLQKCLNQYYINPLFKGTIKLKYNKTAKHNYYGCNLQNGDYYGVCYIFPLIIWYYFNKYYNKCRFVGKRKTRQIPQVAHLLANKQLDLFVKMCFIDFSTEFEHKLLTWSDPRLDKFIEKKKDIFDKTNS